MFTTSALPATPRASHIGRGLTGSQPATRADPNDAPRQKYPLQYHRRGTDANSHPLTPGDVPGRDHWPAVFPAVFAGGGVVGGQVIGKSDRLGAHAVSKTFGPPDLAATVYHALGVDPATEVRDRFNRPLRLTTGEVMTPLYTTATV